MRAGTKLGFLSGFMVSCLLVGLAPSVGAFIPPPIIPPAVFSQSISFNPAPTVAVGGTGTVSATGGGSGSPVIFSTLTPGVCSISGSNTAAVIGIAVGTCTIAANQAAFTNATTSYTAAPQATQSFAVTAPIAPTTGPTFTITPLAELTGAISPAVPQTVASGSSSVFIFASYSQGTFPSVTGNCPGTLVGHTYTTAAITADCTLIAFLRFYNAGYVDPVITFNPAPVIAVGGTGTVAANSNNQFTHAITFSSYTPAVCTVSGVNGELVTGVAPGTCVIVANQLGFDLPGFNINPARPVAQIFAITGPITYTVWTLLSQRRRAELRRATPRPRAHHPRSGVRFLRR